MAGRKAIAADPSGDTREPVAPAPARHTGNHRPGVLSPEQPAAIEEAPDSQTAPVAPVNNIKEGEAQVIITGLASNGSARIRNLKRLIYRKAANLPPGDYCCRVKNMDCRLSVAGDKTITITFSRKKIAFDVVSRLERRLPKGVHPCAD